MPVQPPSASELVRLAAQFGFDLEGAELDELTTLAGGMIASYQRLDEMDAPPRPVKYPRLDTGHRPIGAENPGNGWAWKCSIPGAPEGPLAGVRVARVGSSSVRYEIGLFADEVPTCAALGHFVHVYVDRQTRRPTALPDALMKALAPLRVDTP